MKFSTKNIQKNMKVISLINSDFCYIDVTKGNIYFSDDTKSAQIKVDFTDVTDENKFAINCADFLHICQFSDEVTLTTDYRYKTGEAKGKFEKNENMVPIVDSISTMFEQKDTYENVLTVTTESLNEITRGSIFVAPDDARASFRNLNIKDGFIFSSSDYRIYQNTTTIDKDLIIGAEVLKFITVMGTDTEVKDNDNSFLLMNGDVAVYVSSMREVDYIPLLSPQFKERVDSIYNTNKIRFKAKELSNKLNFISFYAKSNPSNLTYLKVEDNKVTLSTNDNNSVEVESLGVEYIETYNPDEKLVVPFNALSLMGILSKLAVEDGEVTLYASHLDDAKLFIVEFSKNEKTILAKINA